MRTTLRNPVKHADLLDAEWLERPPNEASGAKLRVDYEDAAGNTYATEIDLVIQGAESKVVTTRYLKRTTERFTWG
jgi:hypothetical protein